MYYFGSIGSICNHWSDLIALQAETEVSVSDVGDKMLLRAVSQRCAVGCGLMCSLRAHETVKTENQLLEQLAKKKKLIHKCAQKYAQAQKDNCSEAHTNKITLLHVLGVKVGVEQELLLRTLL